MTLNQTENVNERELSGNIIGIINAEWWVRIQNYKLSIGNNLRVYWENKEKYSLYLGCVVHEFTQILRFKLVFDRSFITGLNAWKKNVKILIQCFVFKYFSQKQLKNSLLQTYVTKFVFYETQNSNKNFIFFKNNKPSDLVTSTHSVQNVL